MKMNISLMKLTIRLLVLLIFLVISVLILAILYSTRYWPDIHNYIHANITIQRIPSLSELELTMLEVDGPNEFNVSDTNGVETSTVDGLEISIDDFTNFTEDYEESKPNKAKRYALEDFGKDYSEVPKKDVAVDYLFLEEPSTVHEDIFVTKIIKDLIRESKLVPKNYGDVEIIDSLNEVASEKMTDEPSDMSAVFPWISTIFVKNESKSNQFEYVCDGALLNERSLITAARCVIQGNSSVDSDSLLVILGKRSLLGMADKEQTVKIKQIILHENFTNVSEKIENDLALLLFEDPVDFNEIIQPAVIGNDTEEVDESFTTAWNLQGSLVPVALEDKEAQVCKSQSTGEHMICASYGLDVALCPSYGGALVSRQDSQGWRLRGVRSGDTSDRGLCFDKNIWFTHLTAYEDWIMDNSE